MNLIATAEHWTGHIFITLFFNYTFSKSKLCVDSSETKKNSCYSVKKIRSSGSAEGDRGAVCVCVCVCALARSGRVQQRGGRGLMEIESDICSALYLKQASGNTLFRSNLYVNSSIVLSRADGNLHSIITEASSQVLVIMSS